MPKRPLPVPLEQGSFPLNPKGCYVYRAYDSHGDLLYVGLTDDFCARMRGHRQAHSKWIHRAGRIEWSLYPTREIAQRVEHQLITDLQPKYNEMHNGRRRLAESFGHTRLYDPTDWGRLGAAVRARREELRRTQTSLATDADVPVDGWREFERGVAERYERNFLEAAEGVLRWRAGSIEAILAGGQSDPLTDSERYQAPPGPRVWPPQPPVVFNR